MRAGRRVTRGRLWEEEEGGTTLQLVINSSTATVFGASHPYLMCISSCLGDCSLNGSCSCAEGLQCAAGVQLRPCCSPGGLDCLYSER